MASSSTSPLRNQQMNRSTTQDPSPSSSSHQLIFTTQDELASDSDSEPIHRLATASFDKSAERSSSTSRPAVSVSHLSTLAPKNILRTFPPPLTRSKSRYTISNRTSSSTDASSISDPNLPSKASSPSSATLDSTSNHQRPTGSYQLPNALHIDIAFANRPPPPGSQMAAPILLSSRSNPPTCYFYEVDQTKDRLRSSGGLGVSRLPKDWRTNEAGTGAQIHGNGKQRHNPQATGAMEMRAGMSMGTQFSNPPNGSRFVPSQQQNHSHLSDNEMFIQHGYKQEARSKTTSHDDDSRAAAAQAPLISTAGVRSRAQDSPSTTLSPSQHLSSASALSDRNHAAPTQSAAAKVHPLQSGFDKLNSPPTSSTSIPSFLPLQSSLSTSDLSSDPLSSASTTPTQTNTTDNSTLNSVTTSSSSSDSSTATETSRDEISISNGPHKLSDSLLSENAEGNDQQGGGEDDNLLTPTLDSKPTGLVDLDTDKKAEHEIRDNSEASGDAEADVSKVNAGSATSANTSTVRPVQAWGTKKTWSSLATPAHAPAPTSTPAPSTDSTSKFNAPQDHPDLSRKHNTSASPSSPSIPNASSHAASTTPQTTPPSTKTDSPSVQPQHQHSVPSSYASHLRVQKQSLGTILKSSHLNFDAPLTVPRGLINKGNLCFANSILQVLVFCPPFYNLFKVVGENLSLDLSNRTPLMEAMISFLKGFQIVPNFGHNHDTNGIANSRSNSRSGSISASGMGQMNGIQIVNGERNDSGTIGASDEMVSEPFVPEDVYEAMRLNKRFDTMRRGHQEDAEEFLGFFLDTLHEEFLSAIKRSSASSDLSHGSTSISINGKSGNQNVVGQAHDEDTSSESEREREVERPRSPMEEDDEWLEVGQKGKTNFTRTTSTASSPITNIFGGKFRSMLQVPGSKGSVTLEPYQALQLDIAPPSVNTIEDALKQLVLPETVHGVRPNPNSSVLVDATKQTRIETIPPILVVHLKRFGYDNVGGTVKNSKEIRYGSHLKIGEDLRSPAHRGEDGRYKLFAVVYHHGRYATGGHYTVDVLRQDGTSWIHIDDTSFHSVSSENVYANAEKTTWGPKSHDGLAYLLFYQREDISIAKDQDEIPTASAFNGSNGPASVTMNGGWSSIAHSADPKRGTPLKATTGIRNGSGAAAAATPFGQIDKLAPSSAPQTNQSSKSKRSPSAQIQSQNQNHVQIQNQNQNQNHPKKSNAANSDKSTAAQGQAQQTPPRRTVPGAAPPSSSASKKSKKLNLSQGAQK